jgi:acyl-coenzyme A synthetase/AMP-(fatty) acid ligase
VALDLRGAIADSIALGDAPALYHGDHWRSWAWFGQAIGGLDAAIAGAGIVGLVARPRPWHVAAMASGIVARRTTAMIYCAQSPAGIAADIERLRLPAVVADRQDWNELTLAAAAAVGTRAIVTDESVPGSVEVLGDAASPPVSELAPGPAYYLLSSGTTGAPKRLALGWDTVASLVDDARLAYVGSDVDAPQIMVSPLGNVSGLAYALPPIAFGRRLVLLDRFEPASWAAAVRDHRPVRGALTPAAIRMLVDSDVPADWLQSLTVIGVGGAKFDRALQLACEQRFGMPVLPAFGATEFGGVIANWTLDMYREWGEAKAGSTGRASRGVSLRIVDPDSREPLPADEQGLLQARVDRIGPDWLTTNDVASIDVDGFVFVYGRADGAINRGGFKILPDIVANIIKQHPDVADAAVIGIADDRLGEVPVAVVELRPGRDPSPDALRAWLKERLVAYQVPSEIRMVDALPRNASLKVSLPDVKAMFA